MSNNLVNQSTKAISTNELRWIGPVLAVVSSGPMDLFFIFILLGMIVLEYDSTIEHSSLRTAEYTQCTEVTTHIIYLLYPLLVWESAYTLNILIQKLYNHLHILEVQIWKHMHCKPSITNKLVKRNYSFSCLGLILTTSFWPSDN